MVIFALESTSKCDGWACATGCRTVPG